MNKKYSKKQIKNMSYGLIGVFLFIYLVASYLFVFRPLLNKKNNICIKNKCFDIKIAKTQKERLKGLMFQESLPTMSGMLFIFPEIKKHSFRMKNTKIPLDIIRLDKNYKIVDIQTVNPCKTKKCPNFIPSSKSKYVLEINAGLCKKWNIKVGNKFSRK